MGSARKENVNTPKYWNDKYSATSTYNKDITWQFERFFTLGFIPFDENVSVLDVGCGQALHFADLSKKYVNIEFVGLDFSDVLMSTNTNISNCKFIKKDIVAENLDDVYDFIVSSHTFEHFDDPFMVLQKCIKKAKRKVVICVPYENAWESDEAHVTRFTLDSPFSGYESYHISENREEIFFCFAGSAT